MGSCLPARILRPPKFAIYWVHPSEYCIEKWQTQHTNGTCFSFRLQTCQIGPTPWKEVVSFQIWLQRVAPTHLKSHDESMRKLYLGLRFCGIVGTISMALGVYATVTMGVFVGIPLTLLGFGVVFLLPLPLWVGVPMRWWAILLAPATMTVVFTIAVAQPNPLSSLPWLVVPLLMARSLGDSTTGVGATLIIVTATVTFFAADLAGMLPNPWIPPDSDLDTLLNLTALFVATYVIGDVASNGYEAALIRLQIRQEELTNEIARHKTTQDELRDAHDRVVQTARVAGMAEIATGVLHNVGNALNTVGVTAQVVRSSLANTESIDRLHRVASLVETGQADPAAVSKFLRAMARKAAKDATTLTQDMARLAGAVEHVANVVSAQQAHARSRGVVETVSIQTILDDVLPLTRPKLDALNVKVITLGDPEATLTTERHQVVQVLENLVRNGAEAMASTAGVREIRIETISMDEMICIHVSDTGPGVSPADHHKVFLHGFTKKATGSGFGLHVSSLACKGLGGSLELDPRHTGGACFTIWLPKVMPDDAPTSEYDVPDDVTEVIALPTQLRRLSRAQGYSD